MADKDCVGTMFLCICLVLIVWCLRHLLITALLFMSYNLVILFTDLAMHTQSTGQ